MAYHGYIPLIKEYLGQLGHPPSVLEVGVDRGVTLLPLVQHLSRSRDDRKWMYLGVDILIQESVKLTLQGFGGDIVNNTFLLQRNSLEALPEVVDQGMQFDVMLLDGDHNYLTVSQEMEYVSRLVKPHGIVIIDDYDGKWAERDLFYSERPEYEDVSIATQRVETEQHGVKPAVDEWLQRNTEWQKHKVMSGEPILLSRGPI